MKLFINKHKKVFFILGIILFIFLLFLAFVISKLKKLEYNDGLVTEEIVENIETIEIVEEEILISDEEAESLGEAEVILSDSEMQSDKDVYNILLLGTDERTTQFSTNARADTIMVLSLDRKNNTVKLVSLQRGMGFPILEGKYEGEYDWITHLFRYGGADLMLRSIREVLNVDVEHYVRVNIRTFVQLIDSVGGVDVNLTSEEATAINNEGKRNTAIQNVVEGSNHIDGYTAMVYCRLRSTDSDWKRVQRQRNVIQSLASSSTNMTIKDLNNMLDTVLPLVQTNLTTMDILGLITYAPAVLGMEMEQMTIPVKGTYGSMTGLGGRKLYAVDFQENSKILHEFLYGVVDEAEEGAESIEGADAAAGTSADAGAESQSTSQ